MVIKEKDLDQHMSDLALEQTRARDQYNAGGGLGGGCILPKGRHEWISVGSGRRRRWDD